MKKYVALLTLVGLFAAGSASAVLPNPTTNVNAPGPESNGLNPNAPGVKKQVQEFRQETKEVRAEVRNETQQKIDATKANLQQNREEARNVVQAKKEELKQKREEFRAEIKKKIAENVRLRLERNLRVMLDAVIRLESVNKRLEERLVIIEKNGSNSAAFNLAEAKARVESAKTAALKARNDVEAAKAKVVAAAGTEVDVNLIKEYVKTAEESVKAAKTATAKAISSIKGIGAPVRNPVIPPSPTSTPTTTPTTNTSAN